MNIITELTDETFGLVPVEFNNPIIRYGARGIIVREDGKIAVFYKKNKNEYKLPGGGVEAGETPEKAFEREILEETGCKITNVVEMGITKELKSKGNFQQISYVFKAKVTTCGELQLTEKEKDEGGSLLWLAPIDALDKIIKCTDELKESAYESIYHMQFMNYRDRAILKYYIDSLED